jgi:hypothetical protein
VQVREIQKLYNPYIIEATYQKESEKVKLRGHFLKGRNSDLPTMIWLADLLEPSENFAKFFNRPDNKVLDVRNVWLLNYRNFGDSDHHDSFGLEVSVYRFLVLPLLSKCININLICCE